jgi:5-methylcytosine-specific restriction enzyme A
LRRRDKGICAECGLRTEALRHEALKKRRRLARRRVFPARRRTIVVGALEVPLDRSLWEADHIVAVVEGGGECGLGNFRTLCLWCHRRVTAELTARLKSRHPADGLPGESR